MAMRSNSWIVLLLALAAPMFTAVRAEAQMIPIEDLRKANSWARYYDESQYFGDIPLPDFSFWLTSLHTTASREDGIATGQSEAYAYQLSRFQPAEIHAHGYTYGLWVGDPSGTNYAESLMHILFRVETCVSYSFDATIVDGTSPNASHARLIHAPTNTYLHEVTTGEIHQTGKLGPGEYVVEGNSKVQSIQEYEDGGSYTLLFTCAQCATSMIGFHPGDVTVPCGSSAVLSVLPVAPAGSLTFQWRRNFAPLTNSGHISGATTPTLTIGNACDADSGYYDVVVSDGSITEPSRLAHLRTTTGTVTGIESGPSDMARDLSIEMAGPNPFWGATSFRFRLAKPARVNLAIFSSSGVKVRSLGDGLVSGSGVVEWDGRTDSGARAAAGIYFLRAEAGSVRESRKIVLLR